MTTTLERGLEASRNLQDRVEHWFFSDKRSLYGLALCRILAGLSIIGLLGTNWPSRSLLVGPSSVWAKPAHDLSEFPEIGLVAGHSAVYVTIFYLITMLLALLFTLGWHTRLVGILALICHVALIEQNPAIGDQGDNVLRLGFMWLLLTHSSEAWSLDSRRRANSEELSLSGGPAGLRIKNALKNLWNSHPVLPRWFTNGVHNIALCGLAFQVVVIYISAGMYKTQGPLWQHGTALYYPLQLQEYQPIPFVTDLLVTNGVILGISTYMAVFIQLMFPPLLLNKITRRFALTFVILLHLGITVLMALPWFSLAMVAYDAIFVSTMTYIALDKWLRRQLRPVAVLFWDIVDPVVDRFRKTAPTQ